MGKWSTGLKLALAALGVVLVVTAIQSFVQWERTPGKDALFTVGTALVLSVIGAKFLPKGSSAALLTAGLVIGGYNYLKPQAEQIGNSIATSLRGGASGMTGPKVGDKSADGKTMWNGSAWVPVSYGGSPEQNGSFSYQPPVQTQLAAPTPAPQPAPPPPPVQQPAPLAAPKLSDVQFFGGQVIGGLSSVLAAALGKGGALGSAGTASDDPFNASVG